MIDSVAIEVPVTTEAARRIKAAACRWRHIDEVREGVVLEVWDAVDVTVEEPSWSRKIGCRVHEGVSWHSDYDSTIRFASFSLCKFCYGENVHLLYDFWAGMSRFAEVVCTALGLEVGADCAPFPEWRVTRLDVCYSWVVGEKAAHLLVEWARASSYSRKRSHIFETSCLWVGSSYSCKLYCKGDEFRAHDLRALVDEGWGSERLQELVNLSRGIIRFEAEMRSRYLREHFGKRIVQVRDISGEWLEGRLQYFIRRWAMGLRADVWQFEDCLARIQEVFGGRGTPRAQAKAVQMAGFYSLLFRLGPARMKATMPQRSFYRNLAELREAGIVLVTLDELPDELRMLHFDVPSDLAPNVEDDFGLWGGLEKTA